MVQMLGDLGLGNAGQHLIARRDLHGASAVAKQGDFCSIIVRSRSA